MSRDGRAGADEERDCASDAPSKRVSFDLAEAKDQQRPYRQDHEQDKPDQEIGAPRMSVFNGKIPRDGPQRQCIEPP